MSTKEYRDSDKGKATAKAYLESEEGEAARRRYQSSPKGRAARRRSRLREKFKKLTSGPNATSPAEALRLMGEEEADD